MEELSDTVSNMFARPGQMLALGKHLLTMDEARRCRYERPSTTDIRDGIESIARSLLQGVETEDPRFKGQLMGAGSFYDGLKVGEVDEFDFMLELDALSKKGDLRFLKSEPGFANIVLSNNSAQWPTVPYCLKHNCKATQKNICSTFCTDLIDILDAYIVQDMFRKLTDKVMSAISLPVNWEHGGFNRPAFGGFRRHGPATLYQFVYKAPHRNEEVKVNMDLTLSIKLPTPTEREPFQFDFSEYPKANHVVEYFNHLIDYNPGLSIIPLYSNFMIATGKADKKYSWKVSCSRAERKFLGCFGESSLLKTAIRVLKVIRDDYLTYYKRNSRRQQKQCKPIPQSLNIDQLASPTADVSTEGNISDIAGVNPCMDVSTNQIELSPVLSESVYRGIGARPKSFSSYSITRQFTGNDERVRPSVTPAFTPEHEGSDSDESDVTEILDLTPTEYRARYDMKLPQYQSHDIGQERVLPQPGSGEYYGPRQYIASLEITFVLLNCALHDSDNSLKLEENVSLESLAWCVLYGLDRFRLIYESRKNMLKSLYFKAPVRTPIPRKKRQNIRASIAEILRILRQESLKYL